MARERIVFELKQTIRLVCDVYQAFQAIRMAQFSRFSTWKRKPIEAPFCLHKRQVRQLRRTMRLVVRYRSPHLAKLGPFVNSKALMLSPCLT